jgi:hypothetical protein
MRFEPRIHVEQAYKTVQEQDRTNKQQQRKSYLKNNQHAGQPDPRMALGCAAALISERRVQVDARRLPCRHGPERHSGEQRNQDRKRQHAPIHLQRHAGRHLIGAPCGQRTHRSPAQCRARQACDERQKQALGE